MEPFGGWGGDGDVRPGIGDRVIAAKWNNGDQKPRLGNGVFCLLRLQFMRVGTVVVYSLLGRGISIRSSPTSGDTRQHTIRSCDP